MAEHSEPHTLDKALELVRAAYMQAMREHGLLLSTRMLISANAELLVAETLSDLKEPPEAEPPA